jgi:hypothetical protein
LEVPFSTASNGRLQKIPPFMTKRMSQDLDVRLRVSGHSHNVSQEIRAAPAELVLKGDDFGVLEGMINRGGLTIEQGG